MTKHYSYRMDHDLGFAPHISRRLCTVCGCKKTTIEKWAVPGSWLVGIGGSGTGKPNALIYAMKVEQTPSYGEFKRTSPKLASYLFGHGIHINAPVLVSRHFYYFGDKARPIPPELSHIIHPRQGCKRMKEGDITLLHELCFKGLSPGVYGVPNNGAQATVCGPICKENC